jgi:hypothetical protein
MALQVTPVNRNLQTRVTFMYLEFEDLFVVLGAAAVMNIVGPLCRRRNRRHANEPCPAVRSAVVHSAGADGLQVRQATRLCLRSRFLAHETPRVLRSGERPGNQVRVSEGGIEQCH